MSKCIRALRTNKATNDTRERSKTLTPSSDRKVNQAAIGGLFRLLLQEAYHLIYPALKIRIFAHHLKEFDTTNEMRTHDTLLNHTTAEFVINPQTLGLQAVG